MSKKQLYFNLFIGTTCMLSAVLIMSPHASASTGTLEAPFDKDTPWNICQGYNNSRITHYGSDTYALDFAGANCDNSASGRNVRAPLNGKITYYSPLYGSTCINTDDGRSIALVHIDSSIQAGDIVTQGQIVGTVAPPGTKNNAGIAHLHMQMWSTPGCTYTNPIPFDSENNARICGFPNLSAIGPDYYNNGTWSGLNVSGSVCDTHLPSGTVPVYRFYSELLKRHFYTIDAYEMSQIRKSYPVNVWRYEGVAYYAKNAGTCSTNESVYRFYSEKLKSHMYTTDQSEKNIIIATYPTDIWRYEGVAFCADSAHVAGTKPVYRFYSDLLRSHLYTVDENEKNVLIATYPPSVWRYEGVAWYAYP